MAGGNPGTAMALGALSFGFGLLTLGGVLAVWFVDSADASWLGGFTAVLAGLLALVSAFVALWLLPGTTQRLPAVLIAGGVALGLVGLAFSAGALPQEVRSRTLQLHVHNGLEEGAAVEITLLGDHARSEALRAILAPGQSALLRTSPLPSDRYVLEVAATGLSGTGVVHVGRGHGPAVVLLEPSGVRIEQVHGD